MTWKLVPAAFALSLTAIIGATAAQASSDGDAAAGEKVYNKCKACHTVQAGKNRVGPSLFGIVGRPAGTAEGFKNFSDAMKNSGITWDEEKLEAFLMDPKGTVPGTRMTFGGIKKEDDVENLLAYLRQQK